MKDLELERVLKMAIAQEVAARRFYLDLADRAEDPATRDTLDFLAAEERRHREFLEAYCRGEVSSGALGLKQAVDAHVFEAMSAVSWDKDLEPAAAFLMAAGQEKTAHEFYQQLAEIHPPGEARELLSGLANEELAHKEKMEYLYANAAFPQTDGG
jgi:rubrerythrin